MFQIGNVYSNQTEKFEIFQHAKSRVSLYAYLYVTLPAQGGCTRGAPDDMAWGLRHHSRRSATHHSRRVTHLCASASLSRSFSYLSCASLEEAAGGGGPPATATAAGVGPPFSSCLGLSDGCCRPRHGAGVIGGEL